VDSAQAKDGTTIAFETAGDGPAVVVVGGPLSDRSANRDLTAALASRGFTAVNYDRRGRGDSDDRPPYRPARAASLRLIDSTTTRAGLAILTYARDRNGDGPT
jgi:pimeloyl-ACP methyl ester carboxylesterase